MITICKIQLTLQIEADGLGQLAQELAAWQQRLMAVQAPTADGLSLPTAHNGLKTTQTDVRGPKTPKRVETPQIAPFAPATQTTVKMTPAAQNGHNRRTTPTLPFAEFDVLCRAEMKRLSMDRRLPGRRLWDEERDKRLPTLDAVRMRYKCSTLTQLAEELGMLPPLHGNIAAPAVNGTTAADYTEEMAP